MEVDLMGTKKRIRMNEVKEWEEERLFTKWLKNHIDCVGDVINKKIKNATIEERTSDKYGKGKYPVDILATDEYGQKIVIENQYFLSNHVHLGEIITYAAWHDASTAVWITEDIDEEHFRAVEYINCLAKNSDKKFRFWILLVKPDEKTNLAEEPNIKLKIAEESDIIKRNESINIPFNANLNVQFWDEFERNFPMEYGFSFSRQSRTDCINLGWGKSYNMNIPFRKDNIKIEVHFKRYQEIFYDCIKKDFDAIENELCLSEHDKVELIESPTQIRVQMPAQVKNIDKWGDYIDKMIKIILKLREIADRYEFCY